MHEITTSRSRGYKIIFWSMGRVGREGVGRVGRVGREGVRRRGFRNQLADVINGHLHLCHVERWRLMGVGVGMHVGVLKID